MYPLKSIILNEAEKEVEAINNALRVAVLAVEVERGSMNDKTQGFDEDLQAIMGLGALMSDLQQQRTRATKIAKLLPSPNQVRASMRARVAAVGESLFQAMTHIRNIQGEIYRLARLNLKSASHKVQAVGKKEKISVEADTFNKVLLDNVSFAKPSVSRASQTSSASRN